MDALVRHFTGGRQSFDREARMARRGMLLPELLATLLALGLDPERCTLFVQSHRPEHTELAWLLATVTPVSWLERTPTYKEKKQQQPETK